MNRAQPRKRGVTPKPGPTAPPVGFSSFVPGLSPPATLSSAAHLQLYRLELISSLDLCLYIQFVLNFLLSPSHFLTFILRVASQIQFAAPRKVHPSRSLRFFLTAWAFTNIGFITVQLLDGSVGTKGQGWAGRGPMIDFVGQGVAPGKLHLLLLNLLTAGTQLVMIILAFAEAKRAEGSPAGLSLVGLDMPTEELGNDDELAPLTLQDEGDEDDGPALHKPLATSLLASSADAPIMHIRLRAVWNEVAHPADVPDPTAALSRAEEGRAPEAVV